jgi:subtilisin-like proprotein convertase family protein
VAGVAAARGGNALGVTGAAPLANLVGVRTEYNNVALANALGHANGTGPGQIRIKNHSYGYVAPFINDPSLPALTATAGSGVIHVFAAGNNRGGTAADSGKLMTRNSPLVINVAALGANGQFASYSNFGANVLVTAPTNSFTTGVFAGVQTVDRSGGNGYNTTGGNNSNGQPNFTATAGGGTGTDYTNDFGGTSSAAPLVAGVLALAAQANPALNTRMAKHLLVRTSTIVHAADASPTSDGGWRANAAGRSFNQNYGFGMVNADALTALAVNTAGVTPLTTFGVATTVVNVALQDGGNTAGTLPGAFVSRTFNVAVPAADRQPLEEVLVTLGITHPYRGDLEAFLQSPGGYRSRLFFRAGDAGDNINWTFATNAFWGEQPDGTWQLDVRDVFSGDLGTWNSYAVEFRMGDLVPVPEPAGLLLAAGGLLWVRRRRLTAATG